MLQKFDFYDIWVATDQTAAADGVVPRTGRFEWKEGSGDYVRLVQAVDCAGLSFVVTGRWLAEPRPANLLEALRAGRIVADSITPKGKLGMPHGWQNYMRPVGLQGKLAMAEARRKRNAGLRNSAA